MPLVLPTAVRAKSHAQERRPLYLSRRSRKELPGGLDAARKPAAAGQLPRDSQTIWGGVRGSRQHGNSGLRLRNGRVGEKRRASQKEPAAIREREPWGGMGEWAYPVRPVTRARGRPHGGARAWAPRGGAARLPAVARHAWGARAALPPPAFPEREAAALQSRPARGRRAGPAATRRLTVTAGAPAAGLLAVSRSRLGEVDRLLLGWVARTSPPRSTRPIRSRRARTLPHLFDHPTILRFSTGGSPEMARREHVAPS